MPTLRPLVALAALLATPALAQAPDFAPTDGASRLGSPSPLTLPFQGVLNESGGPVADGTYAVRIGLYDVEAGGTPLYTESHDAMTAGGRFALSIGAGSAGSVPFEDVPFSGALWVEVAVDGTALAPRTRLEAAPYARTLSPGAVVEADTEPGGTVLRVRNLEATESSSGLIATSLSSLGTGVVGIANASTGSNRGVAGATFSVDGAGVFGVAYAPDGSPYGGRFTASAPLGAGVYGQNIALTDVAVGVRGESSSSSGRGVYGRATASSGQTYGVYGQSESTGGRAVYGEATALTGSAHGVSGRSGSTSGTGVYGLANRGSGETFGVRGQVVSDDGFGGQFLGGRGLGVSTYPSFGSVAVAATTGEDVIVEANDAVLGLYSNAGGGWGSAVTLAEVDASGDLESKWAIARLTGPTGSLRFTFGTDAAYAQNETLMRIETNGTVRADGSFVGGGADLAEFFPLAPGASRPAPGQVVGLRGGRVSLATGAAEQVAVVSGDPAFVGNPDAEAGGALVALVGQVEVAVAGRAATGDLLVASGQGDGTARAVAPAAYATSDGPVLGRVLRDLGAGRALALVGVDEAAALREVVAGLEARIARLEALLQTATSH